MILSRLQIEEIGAAITKDFNKFFWVFAKKGGFTFVNP